VTGETTIRRRGRPPRITREQIVDVGVGIAREQGIAAVTMTSVAGALGVAVPSLYHYVNGRAELLGLLGRQLVESAGVDVDDALPWTEWLIGFAHAFRLQLLREPSLATLPHLNAHGLLSIPTLERGVAKLTAAGFDATTAFAHVTNIASVATSAVYREHCVDEELLAGRSRLDTFRDALSQYPRDEAPRLWALADAWDEVPPRTETDPLSHFDREVRLLVAGMEAQRTGRLVIADVVLADLDSEQPRE
jgi:AcrR family transcriptional regulator